MIRSFFTTKQQLHISSSEGRYLNLICWKESVACAAIAENRNPLTVSGVDAVFWKPDSENLQWCYLLHYGTKNGKTLLIWIFVASMIQKEKVVQMRRVWNDLNQIKAAKCYSEKSLFENPSQQQHLVSSRYQRTQTWVKLLTNNCLQSEFIAQPLSKKNTFRFLDEAMYSYNQTQDSLYDPTELALHCIVRPEVDLTNGGHNRRRRYSSKKWCTSLIKRIPWSMWVLNAVLFSILDLLQKYHRTTEKENFFPHLVKTQVQAKNRSH